MLNLTSTKNRLAELLPGFDDTALGATTPCAGMPVAWLLDHLMGLSLAFRLAARKERTELTDNLPAPSAQDLDPAWREVLPQRLTELAAAWQEPEAWRGDTTAGGITFPAESAGMVALDEIAVHGWDLARATGQHWNVDDDVATALIEFLAVDADNQAAREGMFGPVVPVSSDAPALNRLLGLAGRAPDWKP